MAEVKPFKGIHYNFETYPDLSSLLAPPYDVLDEKDKAALLARSGRNIVAVDLPHLPAKSAGPPECYEQASQRLSHWLQDGTLSRDAQPALYVYHQLFEHAGQSYTRKMFIARVRLCDFSEGVILPHEQTFGGPKEDRLALTKATASNLSPIFGLFSDPEGVVDGLLASTYVKAPQASGRLEGVENRLWLMTHGDTIAKIGKALKDTPFFIADGHHRYGTAQMYRDWLREQRGEDLPADHPAQYVMFVLACMEDPGCLILPYHRALGGVSTQTLVKAWGDAVEKSEATAADLVLVEKGEGAGVPVRYVHRERLAKLEPARSEAWHKLDAAYLHRYLIDELLHAKRGPDNPHVIYVKSEKAAREAARESGGVALLVKATPMEHLKAVSLARELMPQKSTFFHPKLATGLVIHPLT